MIYKTLKKVSEYCQLLDKSKYHATQTTNGVTFTNNGDGTITVNGTATADTSFMQTSTINNEGGHKLLFIGCPNGGSNNTYSISYGGGYKEFGNGLIVTPTATNRFVYITIYNGTTVNNLTFRPQLFDLTEMYGAGNEPTTVEQFRQDFPDEMYDYKPYCFVKSYKTLLKVTDNKIITSYKKSLICTTKNLFDKNNVITGYIDEYGVLMKTTDWESSDFIAITSNTSYTISGISYGGYVAYYAWYDMNKNFISSVSIKINSQTMISPSGAAYIRVCYKSSVGDGDTLQLEEGSTATEYHPYGYL